MKKAIVVVALALVAVGLFFKFRTRIDEGLDTVKKEMAQGSPAAPALQSVKNVLPGSSAPAADEKLPLADAEFVRNLPGSWSGAAATTKPDVVVEVMGEAGMPPQIQLAPGVWLDLNALQPGGIASPPGTKFLVHLQGVSNLDALRHAVQAASDSVPKPLGDGLGRGRWRNTLPIPTPFLPPPLQAPYLWATVFENRIEREELHGVAHVEGTFGQFSRTAPNGTITLEECRRVKFYVPKGSTLEKQVTEAEALKKSGNKVTLRMTIDLDASPKFLAQATAWGVPLKDKFNYWEQTFGPKGNFVYTLALAAWAEARDMKEEAKALYDKAHKEVTTESTTKLGKPSKGARVHLLDGVQDHWLYDIRYPVSEPGHHVNWKGRSVDEEFLGLPTVVCVVFRTNQRGESVGDYYFLPQ